MYPVRPISIAKLVIIIVSKLVIGIILQGEITIFFWIIQYGMATSQWRAI